MNINFKKLTPHLIAIGVFLLIVFIYFSPLLEGKQLEQHDIKQWEGMSKEIKDFREKAHEEPLWTNSMFGGMPAYQISVLYPSNLLQYINKVMWLGLPGPANIIFLCLLGFYLLLISLKIDFRLAIAGAIAYAFCSYNFIYIVAGHNSQIHAIAFVPMILAGVLMAFRGKILLGSAITGVALGLQLYANHLQISYYTMIVVGLLGLVELIFAIKEKRIAGFVKTTAVLFAAAGIAVLTNITNIWATYEYGKYSTRSQSELTEKKVSTGLDEDYAFGWSYGVLESFTMLIPDFMGGASQSDIGTNSATYKALQQNGAGAQAASFVQNAPLYWGDQPFTAGPTYFGAIAVFLFVLGIFLVKGDFKWWLLLVTVLFLMLSWGKNFMAFNHFFFHYFPGYNKFRAVSMTLVIACFSTVLLGLLGVRNFFSGEIKAADLKKPLQYSYYIVGGLCVFFLLMAGMFNVSGQADEGLKEYGWLLAALRDDRISTIRVDALRSLFFISAAFGLMWFAMKNKIKREYVYIGLSLLFLADMWTINKRYLNNSHFESKSKAAVPWQQTLADQQIKTDPELGYRVMNTTVSTFNDAGTSYYHRSVGGYHGAKLKRYQELIENQISKNNMSVINMLNTKYFIVKNPQTGEPTPQLNPGACGPAWMVKEYKIVANADSEITALSDFDPLQTVFVDRRYESMLAGFKPVPDSTASIRMTSYAPNHLEYDYSSSTEQLVVFSEIYYDKGWNAYIDNKLSPYFRADYVLRSMRVPAGKHKIEFKFEPEVYNTGEKISMASSALLILLFFGALFMELKKKEEPVAAAPEKKTK